MFYYLLIVLIANSAAVPPFILRNNNVSSFFEKTDDHYEDLKIIKYSMKILAGQLEKWNNIFLTALEPKLSNFGASLVSIDSNVNNLQERAHVWDTFQLHVLSWNDQLASLDRKLDILNKAQDKLSALDNKLDALLNLDYKIEKIIKRMDDLEETFNHQRSQTDREDHALFGEFAARGILSTVKMVEKKLERLLLAQQNVVIRTGKGNDGKKVNIKCHIPTRFEELFNDMASKIDLIFDKISIKEEEEFSDDYFEASGDGNLQMRNGSQLTTKIVKRNQPACINTAQMLENILTKTTSLEIATVALLDSENSNFDKLYSKCNSKSEIISNLEHSLQKMSMDFDAVLESRFQEQRAHIETALSKYITRDKFVKTTPSEPRPGSTERPILETTVETTSINPDEESTTTIYETNLDTSTPTVMVTNASTCEDLNNDDKSGIYVFTNNYYGRRYCEVRDDGFWTVIQRRDSYRPVQNFNRNWLDYKYGFGDLNRDFWMGNDFLAEMSAKHNLILKVELEDFDGNKAWAEYTTFKIFPESEKYQLIIEGYNGNATDSFSSHNGSLFSTVDRTNDQAPDCCPCAQSYGGGWWFNSCFEANLNGEYFRSPNANGYFRGIIWEHWLGNYSLKKSVMMVKTKGKALVNKPEFQDYYEDP